MAAKKNDYYVHVPEANVLLKSILFSSKKVIESSQSYYKTLEIRREKTKLFKQLHDEVKELLQFSTKFENSLPYRELIIAHKRKLSSKKSTEAKSSENSTNPKKSSAKKKILTSTSSSTPSKKSSSKSVVENEQQSKEEREISKLNELLAGIEEKLNSFD